MERTATTSTTRFFTPERVAAVPPPGCSGPSNIQFCPRSDDDNNNISIVYVHTVPKQRSNSRSSSSAYYKPLTNNSTTAGSSYQNSKPVSNNTERILYCLDVSTRQTFPLLNTPRHHKRKTGTESMSLEEKLRRERQRLTGSSTTTFTFGGNNNKSILIPSRGSLYIQHGIRDAESYLVYDKNTTGLNAVDALLSPDGSKLAFYSQGDLYMQYVLSSTDNISNNSNNDHPAGEMTNNNNTGGGVHRITFGGTISDTTHITNGVADFVSQEEMDRYRGFWWHPDSNHILFCQNNETDVAVHRILHHTTNHPLATAPPSATGDGSMSENNSLHDSALSSRNNDASTTSVFEDHRYPFAGKLNPIVKLGILKVSDSPEHIQHNWDNCIFLDAPREANEYLARIYWLEHNGQLVSQWQNRAQTTTVLYQSDLQSARGRTLLLERSDVWINLHDMFKVLKTPIHPEQTGCHFPMPHPLPAGSFSFLWGSERTGFCHLYLYTYCPNVNSEQAVLIKTLTEGNWMVESILGVDQAQDLVYFTGTYDSVLERHLYAIPLLGNQMAVDIVIEESSLPVVSSGSEESKDSSSNGVRRGFTKVIYALSGNSNKNKKLPDTPFRLLDNNSPTRITTEAGVHSIVMDDRCQYFVDTSSDLYRPTTVRIFELPTFERRSIKHVMTMYDALLDDKSLAGEPQQHSDLIKCLPAPELLTFPTSDGTETLHAALYRPDPTLYGPGPYPLVCAVYGGPHVQRVNRSWSQCADMRAQRLRSMGFCVIKCDNRGSSRRGLAFESAIARRLGRVEVLDQVTAVRQLTVRGMADPTRVGIYGWSYGGYLSAMCLCRAPDVFHVAVAGAPVTSWDGYDTHYTERYMGLPADNPSGYREAAVFDHVPNMRGRLLIVHGLIDENVHFQHTSRLINKLIAAGKDYDLLIFPEERHSPRRLRDRIYMEQRISDYFARHLGPNANTTALDLVTSLGQGGASGVPVLRTMAGHL